MLAQAPVEFLKVINYKFQGENLHLDEVSCESRLSFQGSVTIYTFEWNKKNLVVIEEFALNFEASTGAWRTSLQAQEH